MSKISDLKIVYKILACFMLFCVAAGGSIFFATSRMSAINVIYSALIGKDEKAATDVTRANVAFTEYRLATWRIVAENNDTSIKAAIADKNASVAKFVELVEKAKKAAPAFAVRLEENRKKFEALAPLDKQLEALSLANKDDEARTLANRIAPQLIDVQNEFEATIVSIQKSVDAASEDASATVIRSITLAYAVIGAAIILVFTIAFWVVRSGISAPIAKFVRELNKLAEGDFNVSLPAVGRKDEIGQMATAVEMVVQKVGTIIGEIKVAALEVTSASGEISASTTDLSQRTEEQAASLEETSASMEEIASTVRKNAENARHADELAVETSTVAERGGVVVSEAVTAMAHIEESSRKISDIIGAIDEIARQTNLLALNAAVESARAGEAGRGFAVVAAEVRSLAQRSSQAAKDIKNLIVNSSKQVKNGVDLVNRVGASLAEITASVKKMTAVVADIANASIEQSTGIEQINKAMTQMDEVTQQNSALVEENAATAKTLENQAKSMDSRVSMFRLRDVERASDRVQRTSSSGVRGSGARAEKTLAVAVTQGITLGERRSALPLRVA